MKTRFAPSPTGYAHIGNMRTAIVCYLHTKKHNGEFIVRFDDTDIERNKQEYADGIYQDLDWFNLKYDAVFKQSKRLALYEKAKQKLLESGRIYPCYESPEEIAIMRKSMQARGVPPIYNQQALKLHPDQIKEFEKQGRKPHYRFLLEDKDIVWNDKIKGLVKYRGRAFSDPVIIRENGMPMYTFTSIVDDIDMEITDIVRGEDHVTNTAIQIQIFEALEGKIPNFSHLTTIKTGNAKMSKRKGDFSVKALREEGVEPMAILSYMSQLGTGNDKIYLEFKDILKDFDISNFGKAATNYSYEELQKINEKYLNFVSFEQIQDRLTYLNISGLTSALWEVIKFNIARLDEVKEWIKICKILDFKNDKEDKDFLETAAKLLPEKIDENTWDEWIARIKDTTDRKGKQLFMPIRKALTGKEHGPELKKFLIFIERSEILKRLKNA